MNFIKRRLGWIAGPLAAIMFLTTSGLGTASAGLVATDQAAQQELADLDRAGLLAALDREDIRDQLIALGITPAEAADRINALSDAELALMVDQVNEMPAGEGVIGFVVGVVIIALIVLLVTDALDVTDAY